MSKTFCPWPVDQAQLLPPSVSDFVPAGHVAHFVRDLVREDLDLTEITGVYSELRGYPPFDPVMMTALLLYAYAQGVYSSRRMARACEERLDFLAVTAMNRPDHRTIAKFRRRHLLALGGLFVQVLRLCQQAGMADLGHVALDGTTIKANVSRHKAMSYRKAMSYERMLKTEAQLKAEVEAWLVSAERTDAAEDAALGEARGDEMPDWVADKTRRIAKIQEAKAAAERALLKEQRKRKGRPAEPKTRPAAQAAAEADPTPQPKAQRNFTDPEGRIMKGPDGFLQGYNAQAAVDAKAQIIVAHGLSDCSADSGQLAPMVKAIRANTGRNPAQFFADAGYCSDANLQALDKQKINAVIVTGRERQLAVDAAPSPGTSRVEKMRAKLRKDGLDSPYRLRKQTVEPVFGQI